MSRQQRDSKMANIYHDVPVEIENGGLFISNGSGRHPRRIIDSFELIFVQRGTLSIQENDQQYQLGAGQCLLLYPHCEHMGIEDYPDDLKFYWVHFRLSRHSKDSASQHFIHLPKLGRVDDGSKVTSLFNLLLNEQELVGDRLSLNLLLMMIIGKAGNKNANESEPKPVNLAYNARSIIKQFYREPITPSWVAQRLRCNVDYLGRVYKQTFGTTLTEAIQTQKIHAAKQALTDATHPIQFIARGVGYQDVGYFRRVFLKYVGMTPSNFRKLHTIRTVNSE